MFDVDVDKAEVVIFEAALTAFGSIWGRPWSPTKPFGPKNTPDAVTIEMRQKMCDHEGQVIQSEVSGLTQSADHRAFLFCGLPRWVVRSGGMIEAVLDTALAPFTDRLGADTIALGQDAGKFFRTGDLGAGGRGGAGIRMNLQHASFLSWC